MPSSLPSSYKRPRYDSQSTSHHSQRFLPLPCLSQCFEVASGRAGDRFTADIGREARLAENANINHQRADALLFNQGFHPGELGRFCIERAGKKDRKRRVSHDSSASLLCDF